MSGTLSCDEIKLYAVHARRVQMPPRIRVFVEFIAAALHWVNVVSPRGGWTSLSI
jgi:hypothetical protein